MPNNPTPILSLTVPTVGGDVNTWGNELNADLAAIDSLGGASILNTAVNVAPGFGICPINIIKATGGAAGIITTLPIVAARAGSVFVVVKIDTGVGAVVAVPASGSIYQNGSATPSYTLSNAGQFVWLLFDGANYFVIGGN